jgi:hypothetical protein
MEGCVWSELLEYFNDTYGLRDMETVLDYLDTDFRWTFVNYQGPAPAKQEQTQLGNATYTKNVTSGPLSQANTIREVES